LSDVAIDAGLRVVSDGRVQVRDQRSYLLIPLVSRGPGGRGGKHAAVPALPPLREELRSWVTVVSATSDACLVVDTDGIVVGLSPAAAELLADDAGAIVGRELADDVIVPLDFGASAQPLTDPVAQLPPLAAVASDVLARGLVRLRPGGEEMVTLDVVAAPLHGRDGRVIGSLSFLALIAAS
jgi:PAS domain-containing protein